MPSATVDIERVDAWATARWCSTVVA